MSDSIGGVKLNSVSYNWALWPISRHLVLTCVSRKIQKTNSKIQEKKLYRNSNHNTHTVYQELRTLFRIKFRSDHHFHHRLVFDEMTTNESPPPPAPPTALPMKRFKFVWRFLLLSNLALGGQLHSVTFHLHCDFTVNFINGSLFVAVIGVYNVLFLCQVSAYHVFDILPNTSFVAFFSSRCPRGTCTCLF